MTRTVVDWHLSDDGGGGGRQLMLLLNDFSTPLDFQHTVIIIF